MHYVHDLHQLTIIVPSTTLHAEPVNIACLVISMCGSRMDYSCSWNFEENEICHTVEKSSLKPAKEILAALAEAFAKLGCSGTAYH